MKVFKPLFLVVLISTFTLTACKDEQDKNVRPAARQGQALQELVTKWNGRVESEESYKKLVAQYQALDAKSLNDFINADAAYWISNKGQNKEVADLRAKGQLELNQLSVEKYGKGYNRLTALQMDELLSAGSKTGTYDRLDGLMNAIATNPSNKAARTSSSSCYTFHVNAFVCPSNPYRADYAAGAVSVSSNSQQYYYFYSVCPNAWGLTTKNGQTDCDFFVNWYFTSQYSAYEYNYVTSPDVNILYWINQMRPAREVIINSRSSSGMWTNQIALLLGAARVNYFMGGIQYVSNYTKLWIR